MKTYQLLAASVLLSGCAASTVSFHLIEARTTPSIVKVSVESYERGCARV